MLNNAYQYGWLIVAAIFAGLYFYEIYRRKGKAAMLAQMRTITYQLMIIAEKEYGQGNGSFKFRWVIDRLYQLLPGTAKIFVTREMAEKYIQGWYDELKDYLDDGKADGSTG